MLYLSSMLPAAAILLSALYLFLSILHLYWASGGRWGWGAAIPSDDRQKQVLHPTPFHCVLVATVLLLFALSALVRGGFWDWAGGNLFVSVLLWMQVTVFLLRAVGDFRYVGFFKKVNKTAFARNDSLIYSPLCLLLAALALCLALQAL